MPDYRRAYLPGGTYFFTVVTHRRRPFLCDVEARNLLREAIDQCRRERPFEIVAIVLLPDHLHAIWQMPAGDSNYSARWGIIKKAFTQQWLRGSRREVPITHGRRSEGRRGVWQPRFWEHAIQDEKDFEGHFDYIHFNPVKHGYVQYPGDWKWSSFHRWARVGVYPANWACGSDDAPLPDFTAVQDTVGE